MNRRNFLKYAGATASVTTVIADCTKENNSSNNNGIDLGSGDIGVLNYVFALEQLQAAFYLQLIRTPYTTITPDETALLTDIRDHELAHTGFYNTILGTSAIPELQFDFSKIDFSNKNSVLGAAKTFEDATISAYNGAGKLFSGSDYLLMAAKIVSVEARHSAYVRDLLAYGSFADATVADANGLDVVSDTDSVLNTISPFLITKLDASHLPTA